MFGGRPLKAQSANDMAASDMAASDMAANVGAMDKIWFGLASPKLEI